MAEKLHSEPLLPDELLVIIAAFGGKKAFAAALPARVRTVDRWIAGTRRIRPLTAARIRQLNADTPTLTPGGKKGG